MLTGIDHLVIVVSDLDAAANRYRASGFSVVPGGRHTTAGTHNALIGLADGSYLELLGVLDPTPESPWWDVLAHGGGLSDFCVGTDDLERDVAVFRNAGVAMSEPTVMGRVRPDGYRLEWILSRPLDELRGIVPFLIEDLTPRNERVPALASHANGVTALVAVSVTVVHSEPLCRRYTDILHDGGRAIDRPDLEAHGRRFAIGPHRVDVLTPVSDSGVVRDRLEQRGAFPLAASIMEAAGDSPLAILV